jgi:VanZ family protein
MPIKKPLELKPTSLLKAYTPAICWGIFVTYMSLTPGDQLPEALVALNDKLLHACIYFFSAALIYLAIIRYNFKNTPSWKQLFGTLIVCVVFGGLIELAQHYLVHNRNGDWNDFMANTLGAVLSVLLMRFIQRISGSLIR